MMMNKTKLIVFDIDGTLTDSVSLHKAAFIEAIKYIGIEDIDHHFKDYLHHTDSYISKTIYEKATSSIFGTDQFNRFASKLNGIIRSKRITEIKGALEQVHFFEKETEYAVVFATGSLILPAEHKLAQIHIEFEPWQLVGADHIYDREGIVSLAIERAKKHLDIPEFEQIVSFGDGLWDLITANNLGLDFIGIGQANKEILRKNGALIHYNDWTLLEVSQVQDLRVTSS